MLPFSKPPSAHAADFTTREIVSALFKATPGSAPDLAGKNLSRLDLAEIDFKQANLRGANLFGADLSTANLSKADLSGAVLDRATIARTNFTGANLSGASILRPNIFSQLAALPNETPDFASANLVDAQLSGRFDLTSFRGADLARARFGPKDPRSEELITGRVEVRMCDFSDANLEGANLRRTGAEYAKFTRANLRDANFAQAILKGADFSEADVAGADFTGANLDGALFTGAKGLERAVGLQEGLRGDQAAQPPQ